MNLEVVHRHRRQAGHESLPARAAIGRDKRADIGPDEEKIAIDGILANHVNEVCAAVGQVVRDRAEGPAEIVRHVQVRMEIVLAVIVERHIDCGRIEVRRLDAIHP